MFYTRTLIRTGQFQRETELDLKDLPSMIANYEYEAKKCSWHPFLITNNLKSPNRMCYSSSTKARLSAKTLASNSVCLQLQFRPFVFGRENCFGYRMDALYCSLCIDVYEISYRFHQR